MRKCMIGVISALLAGEMRGEEGLDYFFGKGLIEHVVSTPTNVVLKIKVSVLYIEHNPKSPNPFPQLEDMPEDNPGYILLVLTPDQEVKLGEYHGHLFFTPVSFKDRQKGFRIVSIFDATSFGDGIITDAVAYVAFGDALVEKSADDVEMIMESRRNSVGYFTGEVEWKKYEKTQLSPKVGNRRRGVGAFLPTAPPPVIAKQDETPVNVAEDGQNDEKSKASNRWPYALIPLFLLALLWLARKKRKRDSP